MDQCYAAQTNAIGDREDYCFQRREVDNFYFASIVLLEVEAKVLSGSAS